MVEHQRRQVEPFPQDITDPGLAFYRHSAGLERGDVAVDSAWRDLQRLGKRTGRHRGTGRPQALNDIE
jgi:hypothetical protein